MTPEQQAALRAPFAPEATGKLPKITCRDCSDSRTKVCDKHTKSKCRDCDNWITSAHVHLDYVGHAATTDRLLKVDPGWTWEPLAVGADGLPAVDKEGNLWIRLTIGGVTRLGVGDGKSMKERIGDALRNAAMRYGVALDLWAKEDLAADHVEIPSPEPETLNLTPQMQAEPVVVDPETGVISPQADLGGTLPPSPPPVEKMREVKAQLAAQLDDVSMISNKQLRGIMGRAGAAGLVGEDAIRGFCRTHVGRPIESRKDLTSIEADSVIEALIAMAIGRGAPSTEGTT